MAIKFFMIILGIFLILEIIGNSYVPGILLCSLFYVLMSIVILAKKERRY